MKLHTECKCCLTLDVCKMIYTLYKPYTKVCKVTHVGQITHFVQDYTLCCIAYKVVLNRKSKIITHYYIFCIHSGKIYTGQKKFIQAPPVVPVTNMRYAQPLCKSEMFFLSFTHIDVFSQTKWKISQNPFSLHFPPCVSKIPSL